MGNDVQVLVDGAEEAAVSPRPRPPLLIGAVGLLVGVAIGAFFVAPIVSEDTATPTTVSATAGAVSPSELSGAGTTEAIPGFSDALVAVAAGDTDSLIHILWPRRGPMVEHPMAPGQSVVFDATGEYMALTETVPGVDGVVLSVGRYTSIEPVTSGVTSFAFHDSAAKHVGYTTLEDGEWTLRHMTPDLQSTPVVTGLVPDGDLVAWGDWGWAIQTPGQVILLNPDGELRAAEDGVALTSTPDGWVLVAGETLELVSSGGGVRGLGVGSGIVGPGPVVDAAISPDKDLVAISGRETTVVLSLEGSSNKPVAQWALLAADGLTWTSDGRYLLVPTGSGLLLLDPEEGDGSRILDTYSLMAVDVIPPTSP